MKIIIVDANAVGHRAKHSMHGLSFDEMQTGVIFGFMQEVMRLAIRFETNKFVFCWDSKKNFRKIIDSGYKIKRAEKKKEKSKEELFLDQTAYEQFHTLRTEIIPTFGFKNNIIKTGYEADDIIANIVMNNKLDMVIASSDEDLYQLLGHAPMYSFKKKKLYTKEDFEREYNIHVGEWIMIKAIAGCSGDSVIGIKGVGEKTAIKYLNGQLKKSATLDSIKNAGKMIRDNLKLVTLPLIFEKEMKKITLDFTDEEFLISDFLSICDTYGFYSFKRSINDWNRVFKMK